MRLVTDKQYEQMMEWAKNLQEVRPVNQSEVIRKLYNACDHAYLWHCGSSSREAEEDCMKTLSDAMDYCNGHSTYCTHVNSVDNPGFLDCNQCNPRVRDDDNLLAQLIEQKGKRWDAEARVLLLKDRIRDLRRLLRVRIKDIPDQSQAAREVMKAMESLLLDYENLLMHMVKSLIDDLEEMEKR